MKSIGVRTCRLLIAAIATLTLALSVSVALADGDMRLLWADEFNGTSIDGTKWQFDTGNILKNYLDGSLVNGAWGWGNNEKQYYQKENASVANGVLRIEARKETKYDSVEGTYDYTSARLTTRGRFSFTYGRLEVRMRCDTGNTLWPAIWMLPEKNTYADDDGSMWPENGEIDVVELKGQEPRRAHMTLHYGNPYKCATYTSNLRLSSMAKWHVYALEWDEDCISWFIDGRKVATTARWYTTNVEQPAPFDQNFFININLAVGGNFAGKTNGAADPATFAKGAKAMEIDYVRVYTRVEEEPDDPDERPYLSIKKVPRYGYGSPTKVSNDTLEGVAFNASGRKLDAGAYKVTAYLQTYEGGPFYVKPYYNAPLTSIASSGRFKTDMVTSEYDKKAITYVILLVDKSYIPESIVYDIDELLEGAVDAQVIRRYPNGTYTIDARTERPEPQNKP